MKLFNLFKTKRALIYFTAVITTSYSVFASNVFDGYTFVFGGKEAFLYDTSKNVINKWTLKNEIQGWAHLLRDSSILVPYSYNLSGWKERGALQGGGFQIVDWKGNVVWDYVYASEDYMPHHCAEPVYLTNDSKEKPSILIVCYTMWGDKVVELRPKGNNDAEILWEWIAEEHTCNGSSECVDKPELLDKTKGGSGSFMGDYDKMHTNNISFNRTLNQLVFSVKGFNEVMIIERLSNTQLAKSHSGGKYGKGGDILYRWGNAANYGISSSTKILSGQHGACWIPDTMLGTNLPLPGAGNILIVDNGNKRILEIVPPGKDGIYPRTAGKAFEPATPVWEYKWNEIQGNEGSAQRLPNGNTLICKGGVPGGFGGATSKGGKVIEVTKDGEIVWELSNIVTSTEAYRYAKEYLGAKSDLDNQNRVIPIYNDMKISILSSSSNKMVKISLNASNNKDISLSILDASGRRVLSYMKPSFENYYIEWRIKGISSGLYIAEIKAGNRYIRERFVVR